MFQVTVHSSFHAAHALVIAGQREPSHSHHWHVNVVVEGPRLDADGLLIDFHRLHHLLGETIHGWDGADLNTIAPFDRVNPSAENLARHLAERLQARLDALHRPGADRPRVASVSVTEAPGCVATYRPARPPAHSSRHTPRDAVEANP